jgi:hypothetical protein
MAISTKIIKKAYWQAVFHMVAFLMLPSKTPSLNATPSRQFTLKTPSENKNMQKVTQP